VEIMSNPRHSFSLGHRWAAGFHVLLGIAAALALVVMLNYLGARHHWRWQISEHRRVKLSPQTVRVLKTLTNDVRVTIFFDTRREEGIYQQVASLLDEYNDHNRRVVVKTIDPTRDPADAEPVLARYHLAERKGRNFVVFDCAGRVRTLEQSELGDWSYEIGDDTKPAAKKLTTFNGEALFTAAIFNLSNPRPHRICFTTDHGEHDPDLAVKPHGYDRFAQALRDKTGADTMKLSLLGTNRIPDDCLLVVAGPRQPFTETELVKIENYLRQGGRLLALFANPALNNKRTGLEAVLNKWNVAVGDRVIQDARYSTSAENLDVLTAYMNEEHPIVKGIVAGSPLAKVRLILPKSVGPRASVQAPDAPRVDPLATTSDSGIEVSNFRDGVPNPNWYQDRRGRFPLMVAVEQGGVKNITAERGAVRMVVVGDSLFLDNELLDGAANRDFGLLAAEWLLARPDVMLEGVVPQQLKYRRLTLSARQMQQVRWVLMAGLPGVVLLFGAFVWWRRRS
jgi:ABC-type uncharacterized transport system involved in gliding motility auxiliary subunit